MKNLKKVLLSCSVFLSLLALSCNNNEDDKVAGTSAVKVSLTDAPGDYEAVNIEVLDVKIKNSTNTDDNGWTSIGNVTPGIYNLLDLTGGVTAVLANGEVPSGYLGQIRLILGDNNTVVKNGVTYPLNTPSAQQSGLKLQLNQTLLPDVDYHFLIDFDVDHSVVEAGNSGNYNLHPVLRVTSEAVTGSIKGTVTGATNVEASVLVGGVAVSAMTDDNGVFWLHGIPAGVYTVTLTPNALSGLAIQTVQSVIVVNAETTDMGTIAL